MTHTLATSMEIPEIILQTQILQHFSSLKESQLEVNQTFGKGYFRAVAEYAHHTGFGYAKSRRLACVKAIAEHFERRFVDEAYQKELRAVPKWLQTSNGFAVHFNADAAKESAVREALERHILQITYFRDGWRGFYVAGHEILGDLRLTKIISRYTCGEYQAGLIIATSARFPGASFGYFCDRTENLDQSDRWGHAAHESTGKIDSFLGLKTQGANSLLPIPREILRWISEPFEEPEFGSPEKMFLPYPDMEFHTCDLSARWGLNFPLYGVRCSSMNLLPLIVPGRAVLCTDSSLGIILEKFGLSMDQIQRNPIL